MCASLKAVAASLLLFLVPLSRADPQAVPAECGSGASGIIASAQKIASPEGIDLLEQVDVGDQRQWISIRGRNKQNPVLLVIHGGPGTPSMPVSWTYQAPWEDYFTVVNWDQRGVGKNAPDADIDKLIKTTSLEQILEDGHAVIDHLRQRLGKEEVAILGFSWGSLVGVKLAERYPEKISVYVGVGQIGVLGGEELNRLEIIKAATTAGDQAALDAMQDLGPRATADGRLNLTMIRTLRFWGQKYNGMWYGHDSLAVMTGAATLSPLYCPAEISAFAAGSAWIAESAIMEDIALADMGLVGRLEVPVVILQGRYDLATNHDAARIWWEQLKAPHKRFISFERSAHFVMAEEPGRFFTALTTEVLPLAGGSPDFIPEPGTPVGDYR